MDSGPEQSPADERRANGDDSPADAFRSAALHLAEFKEYAGNYLSAKADAAKLSIRRLVVLVAVAIIAALTAIALLAGAVVLLLMGLAEAIGAAFSPPKPWIGQIIVGAGVLLTVALGIVVVVGRLARSSRKRTVEKYESRHQKQRRQFGRDVTSAAEAEGGEPA